MPRLPIIARAAALVAVVPFPLASQDPRLIRLEHPAQALAEEFVYITGSRELPDGRVLLTDRLDERLVVVDWRAGTVRAIGRKGSGPSEYYLPGRLLPWPGDSTLMVDEGNSRLAVIGPDLVIRRSFSVADPGSPAGLWPGAADGGGFLYVQVPGWVLMARAGDSVPILRWNPRAGRVDTLARIIPISPRPPGPRLTPGFPHIPFSPTDVWTVTPGGELLIVRARDYRLDRLTRAGTWRRGAPIAWSPIAVTEADRLAATRHFFEIASTGNRGNEGRPPGALSAIPAQERDERAVRAMAADNVFAEKKPPVTGTAPRLDAQGRLWVERSVRAEEPSTWDVLDALGRNVARVRLLPGRRLLEIGRGGIYVAARDEDGIERLERYDLPPLGTGT